MSSGSSSVIIICHHQRINYLSWRQRTNIMSSRRHKYERHTFYNEGKCFPLLSLENIYMAAKKTMKNIAISTQGRRKEKEKASPHISKIMKKKKKKASGSENNEGSS